ncbi:hypothetical protein [Cytobacillus firmus]|uniref:hypothetical protein n=1 Tax=Cytobacillus firmus TaxID=1399 RepID=UPI0018CE5213|nr:hypothetical protein [Cytobacillus firmus]MBG9548330.1 hypothetical protein [Cytobacillus firmus]MBG9600820.1 hypothetical protein [Cytobacillus firmus]MED1938918.1 hypothetical protein [Cytobacillus firmus]
MKAALKQRQDAIQSDITRLRKDLRQAIKAEKHGQVNKLERQIENLEREKKFYASSVSPVQFANGFVLNGKLLEQFVKKLPGLYLEAQFSDDGNDIIIRHDKGSITLYDLSDRYQGLKMPKGEDLLVELGITLKEV